MTNLAQELRSAVFAAHDDDAPRLVYADYLQQQGDLRALGLKHTRITLSEKSLKEFARDNPHIALDLIDTIG